MLRRSIRMVCTAVDDQRAAMRDGQGAIPHSYRGTFRKSDYMTLSRSPVRARMTGSDSRCFALTVCSTNKHGLTTRLHRLKRDAAPILRKMNESLHTRRMTGTRQFGLGTAPHPCFGRVVLQQIETEKELFPGIQDVLIIAPYAGACSIDGNVEYRSRCPRVIAAVV